MGKFTDAWSDHWLANQSVYEDLLTPVVASALALAASGVRFPALAGIVLGTLPRSLLSLCYPAGSTRAEEAVLSTIAIANAAVLMMTGDADSQETATGVVISLLASQMAEAIYERVALENVGVFSLQERLACAVEMSASNPVVTYQCAEHGKHVVRQSVIDARREDRDPLNQVTETDIIERTPLFSEGQFFLARKIGGRRQSLPIATFPTSGHYSLAHTGAWMTLLLSGQHGYNFFLPLMLWLMYFLNSIAQYSKTPMTYLESLTFEPVRDVAYAALACSEEPLPVASTPLMYGMNVLCVVIPFGLLLLANVLELPGSAFSAREVPCVNDMRQWIPGEHQSTARLSAHALSLVALLWVFARIVRLSVLHKPVVARVDQRAVPNTGDTPSPRERTTLAVGEGKAGSSDEEEGDDYHALTTDSLRPGRRGSGVST